MDNQEEKALSTQLARPVEVQPSGSQIAILHRISSIVSSDLRLDKMLQELVDLTLEVTACDACLVYLADHATGEIVLSASQLPHDAEIGKSASTSFQLTSGRPTDGKPPGTGPMTSNPRPAKSHTKLAPIAPTTRLRLATSRSAPGWRARRCTRPAGVRDG
jgi:GAF domain-containing protein